MNKQNHGSSSTDKNKKELLKFLSLLDSRNFERLRYVVLPASIFILLVGGVLFLFVLSSGLKTVWSALLIIAAGEPSHEQSPVTMSLLVHFLEIISDMLKAVVFFIIAVGIYSIFITPLSLARSLGIETFDDLEDRVIGVIVVVMSIEFLERFILWQKPVELLQFAGAMGLVVATLSIFLRFRNSTIHHQNLRSQSKAPSSINE